MSRLETIKKYLVDDIEYLIEQAKEVKKLEAENERLKSEIRKRDELLDRMAE